MSTDSSSGLKTIPRTNVKSLVPANALAEIVGTGSRRIDPRFSVSITSGGSGTISGVNRVFDAVGQWGILSHREPDDELVLMEAFFVAMLNERAVVLEYMVSRGFPVNSLVFGVPVILLAVGEAMTTVVESSLGMEPISTCAGGARKCRLERWRASCSSRTRTTRRAGASSSSAD
jgi:hypothetical protein